MKVSLRFFASLRETLGAGESVDGLPEGMTLGQLRDVLIGRSDAHAQALSRSRALRCALDQALVDESTPLHDGAEVAFFPPVTGG